MTFVLCSNLTDVTVITNVALKCCAIKGIGPPLQMKKCFLQNNTLIKGTHTWKTGNWDTLMCTNGSINRTAGVAVSLTLLNPRPAVNQDQLIRLPSTCKNVAKIRQKHMLFFNISFPATPPCEVKRAWYDTLLRGAGTGLGLLNSVDLETLKSKVGTAGFDVAQAIKIQAEWMPTTFNPQIQNLEYDKESLYLFNKSIITQIQSLKKFDKICGLDCLYSTSHVAIRTKE